MMHVHVQQKGLTKYVEICEKFDDCWMGVIAVYSCLETVFRFCFI